MRIYFPHLELLLQLFRITAWQCLEHSAAGQGFRCGAECIIIVAQTQPSLNCTTTSTSKLERKMTQEQRHAQAVKHDPSPSHIHGVEAEKGSAPFWTGRLSLTQADRELGSTTNRPNHQQTKPNRNELRRLLPAGRPRWVSVPGRFFQMSFPEAHVT